MTLDPRQATIVGLVLQQMPEDMLRSLLMAHPVWIAAVGSNAEAADRIWARCDEASHELTRLAAPAAWVSTEVLDDHHPALVELRIWGLVGDAAQADLLGAGFVATANGEGYGAYRRA